MKYLSVILYVGYTFLFQMIYIRHADMEYSNAVGYTFLFFFR